MIEPPRSSTQIAGPNPDRPGHSAATPFSLPEIVVTLLGVFCIVYLVVTHGVGFTCARIGGIEPSWSTQGTGELTCGRSITGLAVSAAGKLYENTLCTHAPSIIEFHNPNDAALDLTAGLPDYLLDKGGSVEFIVAINGIEVWHSAVVRPGAPVSAHIPLSAGDTVQLRVNDAGDNQNWDHACWLELIRR